MQIYLNGWQLGKYVNNLGYASLRVSPFTTLSPSAYSIIVLKLYSCCHQGKSILPPRFHQLSLTTQLYRILKRQSENTLALSLWSLDDEPVGLAGLEFISDGQFSSALSLVDYELAPDYGSQASLRPIPVSLLAM